MSNLTTYINTSNNNNNKHSNRWEQVWNTVSFLGRHLMVETQIPSISKFSTSYVHLLRWYIQATQRRRIERIMFWITLWGILFHSSNNAWRKVAPVVGLTGRLSTRLPNASQTCSIGAISGDSDGQCIQLTFCACKKFIETLAVCGRALSCWKILKSWWAWNIGTT